MARTAIQEAQRTEEGKAVAEGLRQIRSSIVSVRAKLTDLQSLRTKWAAGVASGAYDQADLDQIDGYLAVLTQFTPTVDAFLASNLGA